MHGPRRPTISSGLCQHLEPSGTFLCREDRAPEEFVLFQELQCRADRRSGCGRGGGAPVLWLRDQFSVDTPLRSDVAMTPQTRGQLG
jgi:hypothetical protein